MEQRVFGPTGRSVSVIGQGCWQFGGDWGTVTNRQALDVLSAAVESGVTLIDTADVYGDGHSERLVGQFLASIGGPEANSLTVITKMGRRADPHVASAYTLDNFRSWLDRSRRNLGLDTIPLVQLHCPPTAVFADGAVYDALDQLQSEGVIAAYGVSVERVDEALEALRHPGVASIQIICNILRRKPLTTVLPQASAAGVAVIARVPLASGALTGRYRLDSTFAPGDHRHYNRHGEAFDVGETFSGVPFDQAVAAGQAVAAIAASLPGQPTPAQLALRWVIDQPGITSVIPGASHPEQARANAAAAGMAALTPAVLEQLAAVYDQFAAPYVADKW
ncbi:MAG: aldo/keto reductase [Propionibacteriaceae bacterium]|jgi:aryl-alcohol dehydrogenase-like predicted oxidoreductase|nr:aldo/keto reductase [Propionibacteriaceae bacterium]